MLVWIVVAFVFAAPAPLTAEDSSLISMDPLSMNVSEGATVAFECQTTYSIDDVIFALLLFPIGVNRMEEEVSSILPGGGIKRNVSFVATALTNETTVICIVTHPAQSNRSETAEALLLVQGPPDGVSNLRVEYVDVCCTLVAWDDPYTLSGVPITGYSITVNNISTSPDTGTLNNTLCLTEPGRHVVIVTPLIDAVLGDTAQIIVDISETKFNLLVQQISNCLEFTVEISEECSDNRPSNVTLLLSELSSTIASFTIPVASQDDNNQIMKSIKLEEYLLNRLMQALALITFTNGVIISTVTKNFSTFDVQAVHYSISSMGVVCVECDLVPGSQAQGCHVTLDCDNGDVIEQDLIKQDFAAASGCLLSVPSTPSSCTLLFYDVEKNGSVSSNPAFTLDDVLVPVVVLSSTLSSSPTTMVMVTTGIPNDSDAVFVSAASSVLVLQTLIIAILLVVLTVAVCWYRRKVMRLKRTIEKMTTRSSKTNDVYENMKPPAGIEMQECPVYATVPKT